MKQAKLSLYFSAFSFKSAISIFPYSSFLIATTFNPAITALAGLVPWADNGIKQISLCPCPMS
jgi:hypothetical protein